MATGLGRRWARPHVELGTPGVTGLAKMATAGRGSSNRR